MRRRTSSGNTLRADGCRKCSRIGLLRFKGTISTILAGGIHRRLSLRLSKLFDTGRDSEILVERLHCPATGVTPLAHSGIMSNGE